MDYIVVRSTMIGFAVERHHDKPDNWKGDTERSLSFGRVIARIPLDRPELQARTLDQWKDYILRTTRQLRADRQGG